MNRSGLTNHIDGTDLSLLIIGTFLVLVVGFVGFRCCKRKRSSGKNKALQRQIKKSSSRKVQESSQLLKASQSIEEEFNGDLEDKKVTPSSSSKASRNTKKASKRRTPSPDSPSPDSSSPGKNRNSGKQNKNDRTPKYRVILSSICRREADIESGQYPLHELSGENLPSTSRMDKKRDDKKNTGNQNSTLNRDSQSPTKKKTQRDKQKEESSMELSEMRSPGTQKGPASTPAAKSAILLNIKRPMYGNSDQDNSKKCNKRIGNTQCTGTGCKKCKPYMETSDENKIASEEKEKATLKIMKGGGYDSALTVGDTPISPSDDYVIISKRDEMMTDDTSVPHTSCTTNLPVHSEMEDKTDEMTTDDTSVSCTSFTTSLLVQVENKTGERATHSILASKNTPDLKTNQEFSNEEVKKADPEPMEESDEEAQEPSGGSSDYFDGTKKTMPQQFSQGTRIESVGNVYGILEYASKEWKGETSKAEAIRKGYSEIPKQLGLHTLRVIRGDNYCAIRATLFQALVKNIPILAQFGNTSIQEIPRQLLSTKDFDWIMDWNFGGRFHVDKNNVCEKMEECLRELSDLVNLNSKMMTNEARDVHLLSSLNYKPEDYELKLMEAVKILMLASAIKLHKLMSYEKHVPVFAMILFARDTSSDARQFMERHLNAVGSTGGLEQVEMYLLGYTLGITIRVVRPFHFGKPDFIVSYPDDMPVQTPMVTLVAEDDRHYNILN